MILNGPLLFETALLMLAAFLAGAVVGLLARLLLARPKAAAEVKASAETEQPSAAAAPQLVVAPEIAPLPVSRPANAAEGQPMATVTMPAIAALPEMQPFSSLKPSRVAGETVSGRHIDNPEHPVDATLEDVRAELEAQIGPIPPAASDDAGAADQVAPTADEAPKADEVATPPSEQTGTEPIPLAEVTETESESPLPVEERVEPEVEAEPVMLMDAPAEVAAELQDVVETPDENPVPDVAAEPPLVEPSVEREEREETLAEEPSASQPKDDVADEMAAMRAIEGGWTRRRSAPARKPADLPEGVSVAELAAADQAVADSGAAVANVTAMATAVLNEIAPARAARPPGGFGRPQSMDAPRDGHKDDLSQIKGLAPAIESSLNGLGIYHYDQIAAWDQKAVVWIETHFGFKGRIAREHWQEQARDLARGRSPAPRPVRR